MCDILVDQVGDRGGWGYGMSSIESMALGTCCATQINDKLNRLIPDHPFINITENNLYDRLNYIVNHKNELQKMKRKAYEWVYKHHDMNNVVLKLYELYKTISHA